METSNSISSIANRLRDAKITRVLFQYDREGDALYCSHPGAQFLSDIILGSPLWKEHGGHEAVIIQLAETARCMFIVCVHSTVRGRPEGGARLHKYDSFEQALRECLDLAHGMTMKNAMGGIWEGGAKSVLVPYDEEAFRAIHPSDAHQLKNARKDLTSTRVQLLYEFSRFIASLHGLYLVGEDVNLDSEDMVTILRYNVHTSCLPEYVGGAGNPSPYTAAGVFEAIRAAVAFKFPNRPGLNGRTVLVKGAGNVGRALVEKLLNAGVNVVVNDPVRSSIETLKQACAGIASGSLTSIESNEDFESHPGDVFSPNARSKSINHETIARLKCGIICGAENAQLEDHKLLNVMLKKGITYVPEITMNFMGVFSAYQEHRGIVQDEFRTKTEAIGAEVTEILVEAHKRSRSPYYVAKNRSRARAKKPHKMYPGRGAAQIQQLMEEWRTP